LATPAQSNQNQPIEKILLSDQINLGLNNLNVSQTQPQNLNLGNVSSNDKSFIIGQELGSLGGVPGNNFQWYFDQLLS